MDKKYAIHTPKRVTIGSRVRLLLGTRTIACFFRSLNAKLMYTLDAIVMAKKKQRITFLSLHAICPHARHGQSPHFPKSWTDSKMRRQILNYAMGVQHHSRYSHIRSNPCTTVRRITFDIDSFGVGDEEETKFGIGILLK